MDISDCSVSNEIILPQDNVSESRWACYLLSTSDESSTYVGATVDIHRRLRQHNGLIKGGAKATSRKPGDWKRICYVTGFPDNHAALQFEWRWKSLSRKKIYTAMSPLKRRLEALKELLSLDRPTTKAMPYVSYPNGLPIVIYD